MPISAGRLQPGRQVRMNTPRSANCRESAATCLQSTRSACHDEFTDHDEASTDVLLATAAVDEDCLNGISPPTNWLIT